MTSTTAHRTALSIAVTAVLACLTACIPAGPTEDDPVPWAEPLRAVERATSRAGSAWVHSTTVVGDELSLKAEGALRWGDGLTGTLTLTYTGGTTADAMRRLGTTSMEARYLPDAYYAKMGDAFAARAGGRHWVKYEYADLEDLDAGAGFADRMRDTAPDEAVKLLLTSDDVHEVGKETTRGRHTTHWSGTVAGDTGRTVDIWVDAQDLLVKKTERGRTETGELSQTAYYSDYGVPVPVELPPAADTADFKELLKTPADGS
ncbi:hypothetical protein [Streptomyces flaveolus]|uniref:hypothetical protein n=1 Tax=Streptomyces flaveolus TaxID=67297 RepID=UPI00167149ED|nr:hypothetical protein [Streptomyces flaveolus]GGQ54489.1 putative lipoprotein [Streptomyces flaveolus]